MGDIIVKEIKVGRRTFKTVVERYSSAIDVANDCKARPITDNSFDDKSKETFGSWEGVSTYEEALNLLRNGYQPTVEKMKEKMRDLGKIGQQKRIRTENDVVGGSVVVPLAMMGVPKSMMNTRIKPIKCKVIDVYYDVTCSSSTSSDTIIKNGQKLLGAIMELEKLGYRFNLYAVQGYSDRDGADILVVKIKSSNQPLDLKRMSFPLTHTAFFRIMGFDWYSRCPKAKYRSAYGHALAYEFEGNALREFAQKTFGDNALYISGTEIKNKDEQHIREELENFGKRKR